MTDHIHRSCFDCPDVVYAESKPLCRSFWQSTAVAGLLVAGLGLHFSKAGDQDMAAREMRREQCARLQQSTPRTLDRAVSHVLKNVVDETSSYGGKISAVGGFGIAIFSLLRTRRRPDETAPS